MVRTKKQGKRPSDINQLAHHLVSVSTQDVESIELPTKEQISLLMAKLGKKGGKIGGKRRLETMTSERRSQVARAAARARWKHSAS